MRLVLLILAGMSAGVLLGALIGYILPDLSVSGRQFYGFVVGAVSFQGAALIWLHWFVREHDLSWREAFGFGRTSNARAIGLGAAAALLVLPVALLLGEVARRLLLLFHVSPEAQSTVRTLQMQLPGWQVICYGIAAVIVAPVAEELLFRGVLYPALKQNGYARTAIWATSLLFAATHMNLMAFIPLCVLAFVLTALYEFTDNLLSAITAHSLFNAVNFTLLVGPHWLGIKWFS